MIQNKPKKLEIYDNLNGSIIFEKGFLSIVDSRAFMSLMNKHQLGLMSINRKYMGATHSRYDHGIGAFHKAKLVIEKMKLAIEKFPEKFPKGFEISDNVENAFLICALLHDVGHGPFSHAFERVSNISHEEETFKILETGEIRDIIENNFAQKVYGLVLYISKGQEHVKSQTEATNISNDLDVCDIIRPLISGAIDVDRSDYLARDWLNVKGERVDFTSIFDSIQIGEVNGRRRIVFDYNAISMIEEFLIFRFNSFNELYLNDSTLVLDEIFVKFLRRVFKKEEITSNLTETKINSLICDITEGNEQNHLYEVKRYAQVLFNGYDDQISHKVFRKIEDRDTFEKTLKSIIPLNNLDDIFYSTAERSVLLYDSKKSNVSIQDSNDQIVDISEISPIIRDNIRCDTIISVVDLNLLEYSLKENGRFNETEINKTLREVEDAFAEKEKKYTFVDKIDYLKEFESVCQDLGAVEAGCVANFVTYNKVTKGLLKTFESVGHKSSSLREVERAVKPNATDITSLSNRQRNELKTETTAKKILDIANSLLANDLKPTIARIDKQIKTDNNRKKYLLEINGSTIEIELDVSKDEGKKEEMNPTIRARLIEGNPEGLLLLTQIVNKRFNLRECRSFDESAGCLAMSC